LLVLFQCSSVWVSAAQFECLVGSLTYPCPDISSQRDMWGIGFRTYAAIGMANIIAFNQETTPLRFLRDSYPTLADYFTAAGNKEKRVMNQTVPIGVIQFSVDGRSFIYESVFFLPDDVLSAPPTPVNNTVVVNLVPASTAVVMSWAFKEEPTEDEILRQLAAVTNVLDAHSISYDPNAWGLFLYNIPGNPVKFGWTEIWRFPSNNSTRNGNALISHSLRTQTTES